MEEVRHLRKERIGVVVSNKMDKSIVVEIERRKKKLGLVGRNGRGKTTLLDLIQGKYEYQGTITPRLQTRRFPAPSVDEERDALALLDSRCPDRPLWVLKRELSRLQCPEAILSRPFKTLSHGERTKVLLASLFLEKDVFALKIGRAHV